MDRVSGRVSSFRRLTVDLGARSYDIVIGAGALASASRELRRAGVKPGSKLAVVSSPRILRLHGAALLESLAEGGYQTGTISIPEGERSKSLSMSARLYESLARQRVDRSGVLLALGGGVVGDLTGFVAATYLRGIRYVQAPTTLLACIDSSVGGKTGIDLPAGKNLVGAFHQPSLVLTDLRALGTLPRRQIRSGLYEAIKCAILWDRRFFDWIEGNLASLLEVAPASTRTLVARCCRIKAEVVARDERELDLRRILNLGHTFGHAIEAELDYGHYTHGEAVGLGLKLSAVLAERTGSLKSAERERILRLVDAVGRLTLHRNLRAVALYQRMIGDKKTESGSIHFILPRRIGEVEVRADLPRSAVLATLRKLGLA
ncbi:MAG: 3-dehydroquinate synthase [Acidobacteria bacterium]|nr:3-dehydroquinate synthase [Acidobacteriota bacterium]